MFQLLCAVGAILCFGVAYWHQPDWSQSKHNAWYWLWPLVCVLGLFLAVFALVGVPTYHSVPPDHCPQQC